MLRKEYFCLTEHAAKQTEADVFKKKHIALNEQLQTMKQIFVSNAKSIQDANSAGYYGGGMFIFGDSSDVTLRQCSFISNTASDKVIAFLCIFCAVVVVLFFIFIIILVKLTLFLFQNFVQ